MERARVVAVLLTIIIATAVGFVGISIINTLDTTTPAGSVDNESLAVDSTGYTALSQTNVQNVEVYDSTGRAVAFGYEDGTLETSGISGLNQSPLTVSTWVRLDENASTSNDYHILTLGNGTAAVQYLDGQYHAYWNNTTASASVTASASSPRDLTQVGFIANSTSLALVVNGSVVNTTTLAPGNGRIRNANGLYGVVDDGRVYGSELSTSDLGELHSDPVGALGSAPQARWMLDRGQGDTFDVLYQPDDGTLSGDYQWVDGLEGQRLDGSQYQLNTKRDGIKATGGSRVDAQPVVFVSYASQYYAAQEGISSGYTFSISLVDVVFLVLMAGVVLTVVTKYNQL